jgi:hypothetical protein
MMLYAFIVLVVSRHDAFPPKHETLDRSIHTWRSRFTANTQDSV